MTIPDYQAFPVFSVFYYNEEDDKATDSSYLYDIFISINILSET